MIVSDIIAFKWGMNKSKPVGESSCVTLFIIQIFEP